MHIVIVIGTY